MSYRQVQIFMPMELGDIFAQQLDEAGVNVILRQRMSGEQEGLVLLVPSVQTQAVLDLVQAHIERVGGISATVLPVEACLPRPQEPPPKEHLPGQPRQGGRRPEQLSNEELYVDLESAARLDKAFVAMLVISTVVAAIGLLRDNMAVTIGAMVIAPLLGPNAALALATTLGDSALARDALRTNLAGLLGALALSVLLGMVLGVNTGSHELAARTSAGLMDVVLALASGAAGILSFTTGAPAALVGVMVAVALMPPLVTCGLLLGAANWEPALGAFLLFAANLICVNLAGVITFWLQGVRPGRWWEAAEARRKTALSVAIWTVLLVVLVAVLLVSRRV